MRKLLLAILLCLLPITAFAGIHFDGVDDSVTFSGDGLFQYTGNQFTIACWLKHQGGQYGSSQSFRILLKQLNGSPYTGFINFWFKEYGVNSSTKFGFSWANGTLTSTSSLSSTDTWYHLAATYDGENIRLYINGVEDNYGAETDNFTTSTDAATSISGVSMDTSNPNVSELYMWQGYCLTPTEIAALADGVRGSGTSVSPTNLKLYLPMNDGTVDTSADGDTVADGSGNGTNGTGSDGANNTGLTWEADSWVAEAPSTPAASHHQIIIIGGDD